MARIDVSYHYVPHNCLLYFCTFKSTKGDNLDDAEGELEVSRLFENYGQSERVPPKNVRGPRETKSVR